MPLETETSTIAQAVDAFEAGIDLSHIRAEAERITSLKGLIDGYLQEIAEETRVRRGTSADRLLLKILAAAS